MTRPSCSALAKVGMVAIKPVDINESIIRPFARHAEALRLLQLAQTPAREPQALRLCS